MTSKAFENQSSFVMVLIEYSAVFYVLDHTNLYQKLETTFGIHGKFLGLDKIIPYQQAPTCCHWIGCQTTDIFRLTFHEDSPTKIETTTLYDSKNNYNCRI